ncbi:MAG TPA: chemotaxis protein CheB [Ramlibacter sp.]|nr:chemotaxis protein CheB [Ramlibacter sp.]
MTDPTPRPPLAVVIGASAGGVEALLRLCAGLPADLPAIVAVVLHVGTHPSILPELLNVRGPLRAVHAHDGQRLSTGVVYVAPPDRHLLLEREVLRVNRGPKENHARPAIDPLFRSAAVHWGPRAVGVVLSGQLDDGAAGLAAIKDCGGMAIVQDPDEAPEPGMPLAALENVAVDWRLRVDEITAKLMELAGLPGRVSTVRSEHVERELAMNQGADSSDHLPTIGTPSGLTCPDCGGSLWEVRDTRPLRYRCHTGHAFTARSLAHGQQEIADQALWTGVRALHERAMLLRRMSAVARGTGDPAQAEISEAQAARVQEQADEVERLARAPQAATRNDDGA